MLDYTYQGIKNIHFVITLKNKIRVPLETIFKLIHATEKVPFIKYNPGIRQENIYRLYSNNIAKNGKKIPFLSNSQIQKLKKRMGKNKQVSLFIPNSND